jgi:hypothetical protein
MMTMAQKYRYPGDGRQPPPKWQGKLNRTTAWIWGFTQEKLRDLGIFTTEMHKHMDVNQQLSAFSRV